MSNTLIVDNTMLSKGRECWRKHMYFVERHLRPSAVAAPLNFGAVIHAGKAEFEKRLCAGTPFEQAKEEAMSVAIRSWREQEMLEGEWRTLDKAITVMDTLLSYDSLVPILSPEGEVLVEKDFAVPILTASDHRLKAKLAAAGYDGLLYCGIIDYVAKYMDKIYVVDHKTCSVLRGDKRKGESKYIPFEWWAQFKPHAATVGYLYGASFFFKERVSGVIINAIGINPRGDEVIIEKKTFEYTPEEVEEWRRDTLAQIESWLDMKDKGYYQRNPDACTGKFGKACEYISICKTPPSLREGIEATFVVEEWQPLEARKREAEKLNG